MDYYNEGQLIAARGTFENEEAAAVDIANMLINVARTGEMPLILRMQADKVENTSAWMQELEAKCLFILRNRENSNN